MTWRDIMNNDKLNKLLKDYDRHYNNGKFIPVSEFKEKFFEAVQEDTAKNGHRRGSKLWIIWTAAVTIAAAVLLAVLPLNIFTDVPAEKVNLTFAAGADKLMRQLKKLFPEKKRRFVSDQR